jgi:hypothetical protein
MPNNHGGKRPGAGLPKGYKFPKTIEKELERERLRQLVIAHMEPMTLAQIEHAKGVSYMVLRHPDGTFSRATDEAMIDLACQQGAESFKIFTQAPNPAAYKDLMDRALDKPIEQHEHAHTGALVIKHVLPD